MNKNLILVLILCLLAGFLMPALLQKVIFSNRHSPEIQWEEPQEEPQNTEPQQKEPQQEEPQEPENPKELLPAFENYPPIRHVSNLGKVLSDIESHLPAGNIYRDNDLITSAHEQTHGINSNIRQKFSRMLTGFVDQGKWITTMSGHAIFVSQARINGFYILENRAVIIREPNSTIGAVANVVPRSLRGQIYNLYLVKSRSDWNDRPLYLFDEWSAYANGTACWLDLGSRTGRGSGSGGTVQFMMEFNIYAICVAMASHETDQQLKSFLMWNLDRCMKMYEESKAKENSGPADATLKKLRTSPDAEQLRKFCKDYFGEAWTQKVLGF